MIMALAGQESWDVRCGDGKPEVTGRGKSQRIGSIMGRAERLFVVRMAPMMTVE